MKLLFKYGANTGSDELKELIGHIDKDINYNKLKSDIITATDAIIKIIGQPVYDAVMVKYEANSQDEADLDLIYKVRYPIALDGYRNHAKSSDIVHGNNGRKIRVDDKNKVPFEWMIDRDNENFERKYYKAVDSLIDYLDLKSAIWKASDAFKLSQKYFVRLTSDFDEVFPIHSRLLLLRLQPGFKQCERKKIIPLISQATNDALKEKLKAGTALTEAETTLVNLIKEACVFHSLSWGMRLLRVALFPEGILQKFTSDRQSTRGSKPSEKLETELAAQEFGKQAEEVLLEIEKNITKTSNSVTTAEELKTLTTPKFPFDDSDGFVSL